MKPETEKYLRECSAAAVEEVEKGRNDPAYRAVITARIDMARRLSAGYVDRLMRCRAEACGLDRTGEMVFV
jgi:hypothetical protein